MTHGPGQHRAQARTAALTPPAGTRSVNSYDRAAFTFSCYQFAAHTPDENLVLLFRLLLQLPSARMYLPDLMLKARADGELTVHLVETDGKTTSLETARTVTRPNGMREKQIPDFMAYLNADPKSVDDAERRAAARLMLWAEEDQAARDAQIELAIATAKKKLARAQTKIPGLRFDDWRVAVWINDILHQGRGKYATMAAALQSPKPVEALSRIGSAAYESRKKTVREEIAKIEASGALSGWSPAF